MPVIIYNIFLLAFKGVTVVASLFDTKAKKWLRGRRNIFETIRRSVPSTEKKIWLHCSSLGEFEQGRPLMEKIRSLYPSHRILLTFFSPSGYEAQKNYPGADWVFYLPLDGPRSAKKFLDLVNPSLVIIVKYDLWYHYIKETHHRKIPLLLVSALFRPRTVFFRWYGLLQRRMLFMFSHIFVQDDQSKVLLGSIKLGDHCTVSGDTRFDRVIEIAAGWQADPIIQAFAGNKKVIVAGSTWLQDEIALQKVFQSAGHSSWSLILAPHDVNENRIRQVQSNFPGAILYSQLKRNSKVTTLEPHILVIDNIGMLSQLYKYATVAYVGGGLSATGVHNVLEAAVYYKPVVFGDNYHEYAEAESLVQSGGAVVFNNRTKETLKEILESLQQNPEEYSLRSKKAGDFVKSNGGATEKLIHYIQENRLLTN